MEGSNHKIMVVLGLICCVILVTTPKGPNQHLKLACMEVGWTHTEDSHTCIGRAVSVARGPDQPKELRQPY